ncbi:MAG: methyltransferase, FkbM family [Ferruginibacter sp.]|nr:methyltransferase, FkbM family [Ferruginibacter sp.]
MVKKILKKIFHLFGLEIRRKKQPSFVLKQYDSLFSPNRTCINESYTQLKAKGFYPHLVVDVGVADGTPELTNAFGDAYYIWVEPRVEFKGILRQLCQQFKGEYHLCAAGKAPGSVILNVHEDLSGSSVLCEEDGKSADGIKREIIIKELDTIVNGRFDKNILLKIDVQGTELDVLEGSKSILIYTEVVVLEVSMFKFQQNAPDFQEVVQYMKEIGFVVYDMAPGHNRPLDNALAQVDIIFVKESGQFRTSHNWATADQRQLINSAKREIRKLG